MRFFRERWNSGALMCLLVAATAACGTNSTSVVPVTVPGQPALMTLKLGTGGWKAVAGEYDANANATTYQVDVTDDFELVGGCTRDTGTFWVSEIFGTVDDATVTLGAWIVPDCVKGTNGFPPPPSMTNVMFTATSDVDAGLDCDNVGHTLQAGVPRSFTTWQGLHDLIAFDASNNGLLVRHDVEIDGGTDLGTLPVGSQAEPMLTRTYTYDTQPDEGVTVQTYLLTAHGAYHGWNLADHTTALFVPPDQLGPGDLQKFEFNISAPNTLRGVSSKTFDQTVPAFDLLPPLDGVTVQPGELGATWNPFPDFYTNVLVSLTDSKSSRLYVSKSKLWLERHSTSTIDFDMAVDGYDPAWTIANPSIELEADRWNEDITLYSAAFQPTM